ncbi:meiosis-specific nuclear structural protein 1-like isoform X2 [Anastrepha obliqua]|uniref:meiosis-specific nuclear structural protein 1-like isoform X2 n=1 Tax=Anastrepha obliqua TaxID=95512 RepID=UPI0024094E6B|nr:meiosis-specific nuclear structural protein 1-like isoform X2 [Anastrepha obliqua]
MNKKNDIENDMSAERAAQVNSVMCIVNESIEKLKISLVIPKILENPLTVSRHLKGTKYEDCLHIIQSYLTMKKPDVKLYRPEECMQLLQLIDMFHENYEMLNSLPNWLDELSHVDKSLLNSLTLLQNIAEERLSKSAIAELAKEKKIHQVYHDNEQMKRNIREFQAKLHNQKINLRWKLAAKDGIIKKYEADLAFKKWDNNVHVREELVKSSRRIHNIHVASVIKQKELEEELEKAKIAYEKMLKENLAHEKEVRDEKNKLLLQLQALVKKFDQNIGDKIKENVYLQEEYDEQKRQFDEFLEEYQREEAEYEAIVKTKEEEDRRKHEEKVMLFMMTRAAKIIQRAYRRYRRSKKKVEKKKGKKRRN